MLLHPTAFLPRNVGVDNYHTFSELICTKWRAVTQSKSEMSSAAMFVGCRIEVVVRLMPQNSLFAGIRLATY